MTINKTPSRLEHHLDQGSYFGSRYRIREQLVKEYMYFTFKPHSHTAAQLVFKSILGKFQNIQTHYVFTLQFMLQVLLKKQ